MFGIGQEIFDQTSGKIDVLVCAAGTGGSITGISRKLKLLNQNVKIIGVDPKGSILAKPDFLNDENRLKPYVVEGIGYDFIPDVLDQNAVDEWVKVDDQESFSFARELIRLK